MTNKEIKFLSWAAMIASILCVVTGYYWQKEQSRQSATATINPEKEFNDLENQSAELERSMVAGTQTQNLRGILHFAQQQEDLLDSRVKRQIVDDRVHPEIIGLWRARLWAWRAQTYFSLKEYEKSKNAASTSSKFFAAVPNLTPVDQATAVIIENLSVLYLLKDGKIAEARKLSERADRLLEPIAQTPPAKRVVGYLSARAVEYFNVAQYEDAERALSIAIGIDPRNPVLYENRSTMYQRMRKPDLFARDKQTARELPTDRKHEK